MCSQRTVLGLLLSVLPAAAPVVAKIEPLVRPQVMESYGKLPLSFEANRGQTDRRVKFLSRGPGYSLFLTEDSAVLTLHGKKSSAALRMKLVGANVHAAIAGTGPLPGKSNYFVGKDPNQWRTNVPTYAAVKYTGVYPGIDLAYHGNQRLLEYDFVVAPGADPKAIDIRFQGAKKLSVNGEGHLVISVGDSEVVEHAPVVYQEIDGHRQTVAGRYVLRGRGRVGFSVGAYDRSQSLVIDPTLEYSTYLGGIGPDYARGLAVDASGNAYVRGFADPTNFPTTPGAFQSTSETVTAFVSKINSSGTALVYSTYLGGVAEGYYKCTGIAVDASGNAYVTGSAGPDLPTTRGAFQTNYGGGLTDAFVTKLNAAGSALIYSTYLGGTGDDNGNGIVVDGSGNAYVTGFAALYGDFNFPTTPGAFQTTISDGAPSFVSKLNATGSALVYSTYLGGREQTIAIAIAVDASENAYVTGWTASFNFPITPGAFQTSFGRPGVDGEYTTEAFVTKLNAAGSALVYSTYLGHSSEGSGIAVDASGNAYVTGSANFYGDSYKDFPTTHGAFQEWGAGGFVTKLNNSGSGLLFSTFLGGAYGNPRIAIDGSGNAYVTGSAGPKFPSTRDAIQTTYGGTSDSSDPSTDAVLLKLNASGSALVYSTYLGGNSWDQGDGIAVDAFGDAYVLGATLSSNFPITPGVLQTNHGGVSFAPFVMKLSFDSSVSPPVTSSTVSDPLGTASWYVGPVTLTLTAFGPSSPVSATYYSADSAPYRIYVGPFSITGDGIHPVWFYSIDTAGRQESPHGEMIRIDVTKPMSHVATLPATAASPNFIVQWSCADAGSGLAVDTIYVSDNGGPFTVWWRFSATQQSFAGLLGHTYGFYSIARDNAGNQENPKTVAEAITHVPAQMAADVNGDGKIDCADLAIVKASMGKTAGQTGFDPRADVNHDGVVNVIDLATVSQKLIPGTRCP